MRLIDRFLDETREKLIFLSDLRARLDEGRLPLCGSTPDIAVAAIEERIAECRERIERLIFYSVGGGDVAKSHGRGQRARMAIEAALSSRASAA